MTFEDGLRLAGGLAAIVAAVTLWIKGRQLGLEAAQGRLNTINVDTITALESRVRVLEATLTSRDEAYDGCQRRLAKVEQQLAELQRAAQWDADLIG
jgi:chromosome segregation ATPase